MAETGKSEEGSSEEDAEFHGKPGQRKGMRVVDESVRSAIVRLLNDAGYQKTAASTGLSSATLMRIVRRQPVGERMRMVGSVIAKGDVGPIDGKTPRDRTLGDWKRNKSSEYRAKLTRKMRRQGGGNAEDNPAASRKK